MQNELAGVNQATEFLCPDCGTSAFEVVGTQWNPEGEEFLVMRCLDCLHLFCYQIKGEQAGLILSEPQGPLSQLEEAGPAGN